MKLVVGLGNPGLKYQNTKHNLGFRVIDAFACAYKQTIRQVKFNAAWACIQIKGEKVFLLKPLTYMNLSGNAVSDFVNYFKIEKQNILIIFDDVALPLGVIRLKYSGSAGGHKGLHSVLTSLAAKDIARLRIGIDTGVTFDDLSAYVLSGFSRKDEIIVKNSIRIAEDAVSCWIEQGIIAVMNRFNYTQT
ncbi:MAG: aminoacyl-tRNA hydrolase [Candidatus Omnitrophota bacterium]|nr:MAG: aminoacyl-tRNA hydrolase [Candidatus Omnitrophota bacterium]